MSDKPPAKPGETLAFDFSVYVPPPPPPVVAAPPPAPPKPQGPKIFSVAQLGRIVTRSLERSFPDSIWVEGEVSGARPATSGHLYFALKDEEEEAVIDVVVYRMQLTPRAKALVKDGARIRLRCKPTFWGPRGKLQFIGDRIEPTGKGALLEALEKLKEKLAAEGLFAPEKKRALPSEPRVIGVVTSAAGAVIHDICKVAFRRGGARILLAAATVQGAGAAESICRALVALQRIRQVDVIIVGRGGGSQDDLLAFHDEQLVREVARCRVPIVSAVGHETDITLVDFAADARAATPSQAAEMVVPDRTAQRRLLDERSLRLRRAMDARITTERARTSRLASKFGDPRVLIASAQQRIDENVAQLERILARRVSKDRATATGLQARLGAAHPRERIARDTGRVHALGTRLGALLRARVQEEGADLSDLGGRLDAMSPLKVLGRGYAIATTPEGRAVRDATEVAPGDAVHVRVARGSFEAEVRSVESGDAEDAPPVSGEPTSRRVRRRVPQKP